MNLAHTPGHTSPDIARDGVISRSFQVQGARILWEPFWVSNAATTASRSGAQAPSPPTATPSQSALGQGSRSGHALVAALRLRARYCSSSSTLSSSGMSASKLQPPPAPSKALLCTFNGPLQFYLPSSFTCFLVCSRTRNGSMNVSQLFGNNRQGHLLDALNRTSIHHTAVSMLGLRGVRGI